MRSPTDSIEATESSGSLAAGGSQRIDALDGLRAVAIGLVLLFHVRTLCGQPSNWMERWIAAIAARGQFGVEVFFVLSGFLITTLLLREEERHGRIDLRGFYLRRAFRILPPAMAYLTVIAALAWMGISTATKDLATSALFVRNYFYGGSSDTGHFWTLAIEEQFYLIWPLAMVLLPQRFRLATVTVGVIALAIFRHEFNRLFPHATLNAFQFHYDGLLIGSLLALLRTRSLIRWLLDHKMLVGDGMIVMTVLGIVLLLSPLAGRFGKYEQLIVPTTLSCLIALIVNAVLPRHPRSHTQSHPRSDRAIFTAALQFKPIVWVGLLSYSLYLWQQPFCVASSSLPLPIPWCLLCAVIAATGSFFLVERTSLRARKRWFLQPRLTKQSTVSVQS